MKLFPTISGIAIGILLGLGIINDSARLVGLSVMVMMICLAVLLTAFNEELK